MRDRHNEESTPQPWLGLLNHPSVLAIGFASALSGIAISSVNIYRYLTADNTPTYVSPRGSTPPAAGTDKAPNSDLLACLDSNHRTKTSESKTTQESPSAESLFHLQFSALTPKILSSGERSLLDETAQRLPNSETAAQTVTTDFREQKSQGITQYAAGQYAAASRQFQAARTTYKDAPESLIYQNNALANASGKSYALAVTVPLKEGNSGTDLETTIAILKGAAHAQDDINRAGGIKGVPLKLFIANDFDNSPRSAAAVAKILVQQQDVLGVVGHDANSATAAARDIYQSSGLPSIAPTSASAILPPGHTNALRTVPNETMAAKLLAEYMIYQDHRKVAVFYSAGDDDVSNHYSQPVQETFTEVIDINSDVEEVVQTVNLDNLNDEMFTSLEQLIKSDAIDTVLLLPSRSDQALLNALKIAIHSRELSDDILLLGNEAMYAPSIAQCGRRINNMVIPLFWDVDIASANISTVASDFVNRASNPDHPKHLWDQEINWITATTYDAVLAFSKALEQNHPAPNRANVAASLKDQRFSMDGATGFIKFDSIGDRVGGSLKLFKVLSTSNNPYEADAQYEFQPIFFD